MRDFCCVYLQVSLGLVSDSAGVLLISITGSSKRGFKRWRSDECKTSDHSSKIQFLLRRVVTAIFSGPLFCRRGAEEREKLMNCQLRYLHGCPRLSLPLSLALRLSWVNCQHGVTQTLHWFFFSFTKFCLVISLNHNLSHTWVMEQWCKKNTLIWCK